MESISLGKTGILKRQETCYPILRAPTVSRVLQTFHFAPPITSSRAATRVWHSRQVFSGQLGEGCRSRILWIIRLNHARGRPSLLGGHIRERTIYLRIWCKAGVGLGNQRAVIPSSEIPCVYHLHPWRMCNHINGKSSRTFHHVYLVYLTLLPSLCLSSSLYDSVNNLQANFCPRHHTSLTITATASR